MAKSITAKKGRQAGTNRSRGTRRAKSRSSGSRRSSARGTRARDSGGRNDALALLKADHREVERAFGEFESTRSQARKRELAGQICFALRTHATIEEEIFYPAFLEATDETELHHEAEIEHAGAKHLIEEIESAGPDDDHFEARISVLQEMIRHHVNEEERRGGMFSKAQASSMDLRALGETLEARKLELMGETAGDLAGDRLPGQARLRRSGREQRARTS